MRISKFILLFFLCIAVPFTSLFAQETLRDQWQQPVKVMEVIGVKPGMIIGEIGSGSGYFTFKLAKKVGETGTIYANDINKKMLNKIDEKCNEDGIKNIKTILGEVTEPKFPDVKMDMVIMVYVFHDLEKPVELLQNLIPFLKPGAPLVILDRDPVRAKETSNHFMKKEKLLKKVAESDFELDRIETFLEKDNIYIFRITGSDL